MKKLFVYGLIFFLAPLILSSASGEEGSRESDRRFKVNVDGSLSIGKLKFRSFTDYFNSDYFREQGKRCIVKRLKPEKRQKQFASQGDCTTFRTVIQGEYWPDNNYLIPIVFHVITKSSGVGNVSDQQIRDQVAVLNEDYGAFAGTPGMEGFDTKIRFQLAGITRTVNDDWHEDMRESEFKMELGWDRNRFLNVYINSAGGYLGYAYYPQEAAGTNLDGVVLLYSTVGGRNNGNGSYNQGRTLVHEVGHYLGLLHTFENGCGEGYEAGDLISDTNSEAIDHYTCVQTNTCDSPDPIHNYMNYTPDDCMREFTAEQANRMVCSLLNYRPMLSGSLFAPLNVELNQISNNLIFREEKINRITWERNPGNNGSVIKYILSRKSDGDSGYSKLSEITTDVLVYEDRDVGEVNFSYIIVGVNSSGEESAPVIVERSR